MGREFAIGDVHGCRKTLETLVEKRLRLNATDKLYLLGDLVDRGPDSKGVMDLLIKWQRAGLQVSLIRGNHDQWMLDSVYDPANYHMGWLQVGGWATLKSFGVRQASEIPPEYLHLVESAAYYIELDDYFLVHAGFNCKAPEPFEDRYSMLHIRNWEYDAGVLTNKRVVHGHDPRHFESMAAQVANSESKILCIDNGCVFPHMDTMGHLVALELQSRTIIREPYNE